MQVGGESRWCFALSRWKETEWVELKKRSDDTKVERGEMVSECIRESNYTADNLIFSPAATVL